MRTRTFPIGTSPSSQVRILNCNPTSAPSVGRFGGNWNTGNVVLRVVYLPETGGCFKREDGSKLVGSSGIFATGRNSPPPSPSQRSYPLWLLEPPWRLLVHRCETNYDAYAVAFLLIIGNKTNLGDGGLLKVIIVWLYFKKMQLIPKTPQFLKISQPRKVTLIIRLICFNSPNQKYWLNEKLTHVELQMSFGFRFPEWYNY